MKFIWFIVEFIRNCRFNFSFHSINLNFHLMNSDFKIRSRKSEFFINFFSLKWIAAISFDYLASNKVAIPGDKFGLVMKFEEIFLIK